MGAVRELADRFTDELFTLDPNSATLVGAVGYDDHLTDDSPEGNDARAELMRRTLTELTQLTQLAVMDPTVRSSPWMPAAPSCSASASRRSSRSTTTVTASGT